MKPPDEKPQEKQRTATTTTGTELALSVAAIYATNSVLTVQKNKFALSS